MVISFSVLLLIFIIGMISVVRDKTSLAPIDDRVFEISKCESPIERRLYNGLTQHGIYPVTQYRVGRYRLDLALPTLRIAIECDGKAYHSSPSQKAHDRRRDKYLRNNGWTVLRFSGSRIHRDLHGCVLKVKEKMNSTGQELS